MTTQSASLVELEMPIRLAQLEGELRHARRAFLRASASGCGPSDEQIEVLDAIESSLETSRVRRRRQLPVCIEETEAPLALLRHLARSAEHFQNLS